MTLIKGADLPQVDILERNVYVQNFGKVKGKKAFLTQRPGGIEKLVSINSDRYVPIPFNESVAAVESRLAEAPGNWEVMPKGTFFSRGDARLTVKYIDQSKEILLASDVFEGGGKADVLFPTLTVSNSLDTTKAYTLDFGACRSFCTNGMVFGRKSIEAIRIKHFRNLDQFDLDTFGQGLDRLEVVMKESFGILAETPVLNPIEQIGKWTEEKLLGKRASEEVADTVARYQEQGIKMTAWVLYNAMTAFYTHRVKSMEASDRNLRRALVMAQGLAA